MIFASSWCEIFHLRGVLCALICRTCVYFDTTTVSSCSTITGSIVRVIIKWIESSGQDRLDGQKPKKGKRLEGDFSRRKHFDERRHSNERDFGWSPELFGGKELPYDQRPGEISRRTQSTLPRFWDPIHIAVAGLSQIEIYSWYLAMITNTIFPFEHENIHCLVRVDESSSFTRIFVYAIDS